jgi:hypothetical protein
MSLFADVLQLLNSGVPGLEQLGQQLLQQLPGSLQQLGAAFQQGTLNIQQAMHAAATDVGNQIHGLANQVGQGLAGLAGASIGPMNHGHQIPRASAPSNSPTPASPAIPAARAGSAAPAASSGGRLLRIPAQPAASGGSTESPEGSN